MVKLLFVSQYPFYPDISGGSEQSALYLFKSLLEMGWQIEVICTRDLPYVPKWRSAYYWKSCWYSLLHLRILFPLSRDEELGYPCWRVITPSRFINEHSWLEFLDKRLREYQPDVVLGHTTPTCPLLNYAASQAYLTIYFARDMAGFESGDNTLIPDGVKVLANSPFTASIVTQLSTHVPKVILPFIEVERYQVSHRQREYITFINPIPEKGVNVAIEVARQLPEEKFLFVKGKWPGYSELQNSLLEQVDTLPNVEIWEHQQDMRHVYALTDILLVPSQFEEAFGRVIVEAQINSIPVVAANRCGIAYTLGKGGILIEPIDKPQAYVDAIRLLRTDDNLYTELSKLAFQNSQRQEFDPQYQVKKFVHFFESWV
ncbi:MULTISPECIES: glycosyltransferase [unclassified Anabaena]|uniref:glycosyltransferase n=1 Tax=unclassified Anabaena TaxID=2619674 RepID=UPI0009ED54C5|nr:MULTISPECIES: glycosyltransferase [unclassified Anabaena]